MSTADAASERDPLDLLAERFLAQFRAGEPVTVESFAAQHEDHAAELRDLLPTLLALEEVKRDRASSDSGHTGVSLPRLERLGDFRIEGELGRGGMGVVFEAVQESLARRVALKVMPQASLLTANQLQRFQREAQIAAKLHHTHIVPVYGSGENDGYHWYAMQYIAGKSLDRWRAEQQDHLPSGSGAWRNRARFVARIGADAASALHFAHGLGTLHRDIKPGNFMLDQHDHVWVTDFGLAKALESEGITHSGDVLGTLQYMAPEQFAGRYDVRSEVYALGATLYELLALRPAFRGRNRSELMECVQAQRVVPLAKASPDLPSDLIVVIEKAMARDPADRYHDAEQLQHDLEAFLEDRPIQARRLSKLATTWRWCRRNRGTATAIALAAAAMLLAAVTGWVAYGVTGDALAQQKRSAELAQNEGERAENNLRRTLTAFGDVFDALVGSDLALGFDEDPDTGEQTVVVHSPVEPRDVALMQKMLAFYRGFATDNQDSQSLRYETARAHRRVGAIHARLGRADSLEAAESAFRQALQGFEGITERDVRGDVATVHTDLGRMYQRRGRNEEANASYRQALLLLEQLPNADGPAVRLEQAEVLFELSRVGRWRSRGSPGRQELSQALQLVDELLTGAPADPEVLVLKARCLVATSRGPRRLTAQRGGGVEPERLEEAVEILRRLVAEYPDRLEYRYELCEAILERTGGGGRRSESDLALSLLREADQSAARLFEEQPLFEEYRALYGAVRSAYGQGLYEQSRRLTGQVAADRKQEAKVALQTALELAVQLVPGDGRADPRFVRNVVETRAALGNILLSEGSVDEAREQADQALVLREQMLAMLRQRMEDGRPRRGERGDGDEPRPVPDDPPPQRPPPERQPSERPSSERPSRDDGRGRRPATPPAERRADSRRYQSELDTLVQGLDDAQLLERWRNLRWRGGRRRGR